MMSTTSITSSTRVLPMFTCDEVIMIKVKEPYNKYYKYKEETSDLMLPFICYSYSYKYVVNSNQIYQLYSIFTLFLPWAN